MKTKRYFAEQIINGLINDDPNIDWNIDERDIFVRLDSVVNTEARKGFFENWKVGYPGISEGYVTTWDGASAITVVDPGNNNFSYFEMPVNYADLPLEQGIQGIWPQKWLTEGKNHNVIILNQRDVRLYHNNMAGNMAGRLAGYPQGTRFYFTTCDVKKKYGNMGLRLVVRDSSLIGDDAVYPIPASQEEFVVNMCIAWFREKRSSPTDKVRDKNDQV